MAEKECLNLHNFSIPSAIKINCEGGKILHVFFLCGSAAHTSTVQCFSLISHLFISCEVTAALHVKYLNILSTEHGKYFNSSGKCCGN